uniref:Uncharacterized protein n=1 Tax=Onchocerca volvulus TaxID=6282 RepID=A0A8R1TNM1_ONCVO
MRSQFRSGIGLEMIQHCAAWFIDSDAIYFYDNRSGNLDYREINTTDRPTCADKGFLCPTLYSPMELFPHLANVADFIIISFLVYLSLAKVKDGLFKYFTLNLMAICSVMTIADLVIDGINTVDLITNIPNSVLGKAMSQFRKYFVSCFSAVCSYCLLLSVRESDFLCETFREQKGTVIHSNIAKFSSPNISGFELRISLNDV